MPTLSYGRALTQLAADDPQRTAIVCSDTTLTVVELEQRANRMARCYIERGVEPGSMVTMGLANGVALAVHLFASWKCGAVPNPISPRLPQREIDAIVARADPALIVGLSEHDASGRPTLGAGYAPPADVSEAPVADVVSPHVRALASGGSTGTPKLIVLEASAVHDPDRPDSVLSPRGSVLVPGPMYHAAPFSSFVQAVLAGVKAVVMQRFDASECLALIERHRVEQVLFVPTMMHRLWRLPEEERRRRDLTSLRVVFTGGAPCPPWLMRAWIEWVGADVMQEVYGPSERIGGTRITGREWLAHPGSVGKPTAGCQLRILDPETQRELPAGEMGEIFMMPAGGQGSTYRYVGATSRKTVDGWESVGDMGYVDEDGFLFLTDRRTDMILCGGRNIYPAQIEGALDEHPAVASSAVIGLPDEDLGQRIHAIVQASGVDDEELRAHLRQRLAPYALPHSFELVDFALRDEAGKVRRYALRQARVDGSAKR